MMPYHERYIEMFAGGLSMYFRKQKVASNIVNDLDNDIVNLYISVLERFNEFSRYVYLLPRSRKLFEDFREEIMTTKSEVQMPDPRRAAMYYYVIKNSFNRNPYNPFSKSEKKMWSSELVEEIKWSKKMLDGTVIENLDYRELVKRYPPKLDDFWYMDPPYVVAGERKDYYFHDFNMEMHTELQTLCDELNNCGAKFMVSYDNRDEVRKMYEHYTINEIKCVYAGAVDKKERIELVITNYEPTRTEQQKLF